ncbi:MAG TPA: mycothiol synthase [Nocardioides sp.]|uniref:mycothiol synthase n=1 Tax=Nocardioides sp. TaxID=35761 RepID=UPI002E2FA305|nr:mycothiol synthase [Nocardioides sp.]HEX3932311.1 mycothiol synthase [Nocardioides sp.]
MPVGELPAARAVVLGVAEGAAEADGATPLDEAARIALGHDDLGGGTLWVAPDAYAFRRGPDLDLAVAPAARRQGLGRALAEAALAEAPADVRAWSHADHPAAAALARAFGFDRVRELWVMAREAGPVDVSGVDGVTIRGYRDSDADEVLRVNAAAFAHHPEQGSMDAANLAERMAEPWFDPAGLLVADAGDGLLAFHWTKQHDAEHGEVYVVAVDPAAQGRGLGRAVTAAGLAHLASLGVHRIILYVESDNAAALATYAGLGFAHTSTHVQYARRHQS